MTRAPRPKRNMSTPEFIALMAMMFATIAFSIDAMLPALPEIAGALTPLDPNRAQLILTSFVLGLGVGTFFTGPLSDRFGRKPIIFWGAAVYVLACLAAYFAESLEMILLSRVVMGIGAAGPRVVALAIIRDLYQGREMAKIMSFAMIVFTLVPALAPLIGAGIIALVGWRGIFLAFILFVSIAVGWLMLRQPETLPKEMRKNLTPAHFASAMRDIFGRKNVVLSILVQSLTYGLLFGHLSTVQPVFEQTFDRAESFPLWFAMISLIAGTASFLNAMIVERFGMRLIVLITLSTQVFLALALAAASYTLALPDAVFFASYIIWGISLFAVAGLTIGNVNAMAMEPLGHIAGMGASIIGSVSTVLGAAMAIPIGLLFDGTPTPVALCIAVAAFLGSLLVRHIGPTQQSV